MDANEAVAAAMVRAGVPSRYLGVQALEPPKGSTYIAGPVGSGKTHRACSLLKGFIAEGMRGNAEFGIWSTPEAWFVTGEGYLRQLKADFDGGWKAEAMMRAPFLVIDDLGQESPTRWAVAELFRLIDHRYGNELPTVVTSQFTPDGIAKRLRVEGGEEQAVAMVSRLFEMCELVVLDHADRRLS